MNSPAPAATPAAAETLVPEILVVDDDARLRALLQRFLSDSGMAVATAADAQEARQLLASLRFDLVILDIMMPGEDGLSLTPHVTGERATPVLLLSAKGETEDRIVGLSQGADDYLAKPFEPRELLLRVQAILRRNAPTERAGTEAVTTDGTAGLVRDEITYDLAHGRLYVRDQEVTLSVLEQHLLAALAAQPGEALSRQQLVAGFSSEVTERAVDVQVTRLRKKVEQDPKAPRFIQTIRGIGYRLVVDA